VFYGVVFLTTLLAAMPARAEVGGYGIGTPASAEEVAGWDIDIRPDGKGLPPGSGSVEDGEMLYEEKCASCHGSFGEGVGRYPILAGGEGSLTGFVLAFMALFVAAGIGNGSTFRMIPIIFRTLREREVGDQNDQAALAQARRVGSTEGAATLGFSSAVAALGGFFIPIAYGTSIKLTGSPQGALVFFSVFYLSCVLGTWRWYARRSAEVAC